MKRVLGITPAGLHPTCMFMCLCGMWLLFCTFMTVMVITSKTTVLWKHWFYPRDDWKLGTGELPFIILCLKNLWAKA